MFYAPGASPMLAPLSVRLWDFPILSLMADIWGKTRLSPGVRLPAGYRGGLPKTDRGRGICSVYLWHCELAASYPMAPAPDAHILR